MPNFSVCMMQNAFSISLRVWLLLAAQGDAPTPAPAVPHLLFALSTCFFLPTLAGLWQRRAVLRKLGLHKSLGASHFPFVLTATTHYQYMLYLQLEPSTGGARAVVLAVWCFLLTLLALGQVLLVDYAYIKCGLFTGPLLPPVEAEAEAEGGANKDQAILANPNPSPNPNPNHNLALALAEDPATEISVGDISCHSCQEPREEDIDIRFKYLPAL